MFRIITFRDPNSAILFKPAKDIEVFDNKLKDLAAEMKLTLQSIDALGLAAPQINQGLAICAIKTGKEVQFFCNPEIISESEEKDKMEEGCLSFPNVFLEISRARRITVSYRGLDGKKKKIKAEGIFARTLQHEIDHLNGIAFIERA